MEPIVKKRLGRPPKFPKQEPKRDDEEKKKSNKLNGTKKSSEKKLSRLSSVSSGTSSAQSSNDKPIGKKQLETIDYEDDLVNQSDDLEDIDELDDIIVSDYELNDEPIIKQEILKPSNTNLSLTATYKVKIQLRGTSNNIIINKQKENIEFKNDPTTPQKLTNLFKLNTPSATPSKTNQSNQTNGNQNELEANQLSNITTYFECPECDKKFVSHYGLFQHYDQHPALAVTCPMCSITFENHHVLILHYKNAHNIQSKDKEEEEPKHKPKTKNKNKLKPIDEVVPNQEINNDLSALPSIMTRTSRLSNLTPQNHKPSLITAAALLNHSLKYKTSGFADLSFIDFSCVNFPRIAQNFCELWPRKLQSGDSNSQQPLHNYMCNKCGFYFPCKASLVLHQMNKFSSFNKHLSSNDNKTKSNCQLFMTNSKYLCYEKCLDEIITKIEQEQEQQQQTSDFLKSFDLVSVQTLPKLTELNNTEKLMLKMRQQMLDINQQFIIDLDKWKFIHLNDQIGEPNDDFSSKINLKPHVNLNRPLLIKSKKIKRNQKLINGRISPQKQPISDISLNSDSAKFSKPFFSATSGNFSAAAINTKPKPTMNSMLVAAKKRKIIEKQTKLGKKPKPKDEESSDEIEDESNSSDEVPLEEEDMKPNQLVQRRIASDIPPSSKTLLTPTPIYSSAANSSILANASGMNNNHLMQSKTSSNVQMPKLQPVNSVRNLSSNYIMPKLKPYNSYQANKRPSLPPPSPLTLMSSFNSRETNNTKKQKVDEIKMPQLTKSNINQVTNTPSLKNSENISLKCKFCFEVFKGQSEFFQHVIVDHPKMLEKRLNRPTGKSTKNSRRTSKDVVFKQPTTSSFTSSANSSSHFSK